MTPALDATIADLREKLEGATPGPWFEDVDDESVGRFITNGKFNISTEPSHNNAALIVAAVNALPGLLAEIARLREAVSRGAPDGWRLVPVEPTEAMITAGRLARMNIEGGYGGPSPWEAMLAALPAAPTGSERP